MHRRGFTLVELALVAAIIAVLSAVALPRYSASVMNYRTQAAARRLAMDLSMAQAQARASSSSRLVRFASSSYVIEGITGLDEKATYSVDLSAEPYQCSVSVTLPTNSVTFDGYGWPNRGGDIKVSAGDFSRKVTIDPLTGIASVR